MLFSSASHKANIHFYKDMHQKMNGMTTVNTFIIKLREGYALSKFTLYRDSESPYTEKDADHW